MGAENYILNGFVNGESATVTKIVGRYADPATGSGISVSVELTANDFRPAVGTELTNYTLPLGTVSGPIGTILPQVNVSIARALVVSSASMTEPAPTKAPASSPASAADAASDADPGKGSPALQGPVVPSVGGSPVSALPPSPIPDRAPPTPHDSADVGDPVLALASAPGGRTASQGAGLTSVGLLVVGGMLGAERSIPASSGRLPGFDMAFSGSGRVF